MSDFFETNVDIRDGRHHNQGPPKIVCDNVSFWYGPKQALKAVNLAIYDQEVTAFIGPSGCGKSTLLRCLNRTNDLIPDARLEGRIKIDGTDLYAPEIDPAAQRRRFGWVAQKPNPFPSSVFDNVAYGPRLHGRVYGRTETEAVVHDALQRVGLWDEVKNRLKQSGASLSGGQQQRLCIARAIAYEPEVILMDEPCSSLDPLATERIERLMDDLRARYAIVLITHNLTQAARVAQRMAMFHLGELVEAGDVEDLFRRPGDPRTRDFITGRFG